MCGLTKSHPPLLELHLLLTRCTTVDIGALDEVEMMACRGSEVRCRLDLNDTFTYHPTAPVIYINCLARVSSSMRLRLIKHIPTRVDAAIPPSCSRNHPPLPPPRVFGVFWFGCIDFLMFLFRPGMIQIISDNFMFGHRHVNNTLPTYLFILACGLWPVYDSVEWACVVWRTCPHDNVWQLGVSVL